MAFWYDINNKKYAENDKRSWTRAYSEKLVGDLRDEQNSKFGKHTSGADYRHPAADLDCTNGKTVQEVLDSHTSTCQSLTEAVGKKVDKVTGKGLSANDYTDSDKAEVAKVKDKVDKVTGKGLSSNDYTSEEKAEVAKIKDKVDKVTGKGLSANDYTAAEKAEVAKIKDKVDKVTGKGLSSNDFTDGYKTKLDNLDTNLSAKANASAVLTKTNTTAFTPTADYQPATKKYVDDLASNKGGGDMMKAVYDQDASGTVDDSDKLGGQLPSYYAKASDLTNKVDKVSGKGLSTNDFTSAYKTKLDNLDTNLSAKVDKVTGKGLSANDFTSTYKTKLDNLDTNLSAKANASAVLTKTNTTAFTPTADYQPATKKYVDDKASSNTVSLCQWHNGEFLGLGKFEGISSATAYSVTIPAGVSLVKVTYGSHVPGDGSGTWNYNMVALRKNGTMIGFGGDYQGSYAYGVLGNSLNAQIVSVTSGDVLVLHSSDVKADKLLSYDPDEINKKFTTMPTACVPYCTMIVEAIE